MIQLKAHVAENLSRFPKLSGGISLGSTLDYQIDYCQISAPNFHDDTMDLNVDIHIAGGN